MAVRTKNNQIADVAISTVAVNMSNFQNSRDAKATMSAQRVVTLKSKFPIVDTFGFFSHRFSRLANKEAIERWTSADFHEAKRNESPLQGLVMFRLARKPL